MQTISTAAATRQAPNPGGSYAAHSQFNPKPNKRDFANVLDASLMILHTIGCPSRRLGIINAIQGKAGARIAFSLDHKTLALAMQHTGNYEAARAYVRRELDALEAFQAESRYVLFGIKRGGDNDHTRTAYVDHLTPAALWAVEQARRDVPAWAENPGKAIGKYIPDAIKKLPRGPELEPDAPTPPTPEPRGFGARTDPIFKTHCTHALKRASAALELVQARDGDPVRTALRIAHEIVRRAHALAGVEFDAATTVAMLGALSDRAAWAETAAAEVERTAEMSHESLPPGGRGDEAAGVCPDDPDAGQGGRQICNPVGAESQQNEATAPRMVDVALVYAECRGWRVLPLHTPDGAGGCSCPAGLRCERVGKHPRIKAWQQHATTDAATILEWWRKWPEANIGIATGADSGIWALDVDPLKGGDVTLAELFDAHGGVPETAAARTGGGGWHLLFEHPGGALKNSVEALGPGLDVRADGGYIVAAPSRHASGALYEWLNDHDQPAPPPAWLIECLTSDKPSAAESTDMGDAPPARGDGDGSIPEGTRNNKLFAIACAMRGSGAGFDEILVELRAVNARCVPRLSDDEVERTARSAASYPTNAQKAARANGH